MGDMKLNQFCRKLHETLKSFLPTLECWMEDDFKIMDPFELEYSENYAPANAAVIVSSVYRDEKDPSILAMLDGLIERCVELLGDRANVSPFCRVFIIHYSLMAIIILPKKEREVFGAKYRKYYSAYIDDCEQINTNCAALQLGTEIFLEILKYRKSDRDYILYLVDFIANAQKKSGFINDEVSTDRQEADGMPIAYHGFILYILISITAIVKLENAESIIEDELMSIKAIVDSGTEWLKYAISIDGSFAMVGRSSYQIFTWGVLMVISSYYRIGGILFLNDVYENWNRYIKGDGSYSCTPNYLPHSMRVGYESYTHVNMYNTLSLTGLVISKVILENSLFEVQEHMSILPNESNIIDYDSGYAFLRNETTFIGCTLRTHSRRYAPSMQVFHIRLGRTKLPIAEAKIIGEMKELKGPWEGVLFLDENGVFHYPISSKNVKAHMLERGIGMEFQNDFLICNKDIEVYKNKVCWSYKIKAKHKINSCRHVIPILVHDGKDELHISKGSSEQQILLKFGEHLYSLTCDNSQAINLSLERSFKSVSGISSNIYVDICDSLESGEEVGWCSKLTILDK